MPYTTLGYAAGCTEKVWLLAVVSAVVYRGQDYWPKRFRRWMICQVAEQCSRICAAWYEEEARGLGLPFPPLKERYERLEETLQICHQMWGEQDGPFDGRYYHLARTLNSPQPITRPHPPILIGGSGERKTLRLVARYADACNIFDGPEVAHKLEILREHCEREGRDYSTIEKTFHSLGRI